MVTENENKWSIPLLFPANPDNECEICGKLHKIEKCSFIDATAIQHVKDKPTPSYARLTLPEGLEVQDLTDETKKVAATRLIPKGTQFGPFIAKTSSLMDVRIEFPLKVFLGKEEENVYLESYDELFCNWMCLVSPASNYAEQNLCCYQLDSSIYYCTLRNINVGQELKVWYAPYYAEKMGVSLFAKPSELVHSSDEEYQEIFASLQSAADIPEHDYMPKLKKRRRIPKKIPLGENYYRAVPPSDVLPAEVLGARERRPEWTCPECGQVETNVAAYARHLMVHYREPAFRKFPCPYCPRYFRKDGYNRRIHVEHCKRKHEKEEAENKLRSEINQAICNFHQGPKVDGSENVCETFKPGTESSYGLVLENGDILLVSTKDDLNNQEVLTNNNNDNKEVKNSKECYSNESLNENMCTNTQLKLPLQENSVVEIKKNIPNEIKENITNDKTIEKSLWNTADNVSKSNNSEQINSNSSHNVEEKVNWIRDEKFVEADKSSMALVSLADNLLEKSHLNPPILDLSDDIDFNLTKSLADMINEDCNLDKSLSSFCKNGRGLDLFDNVTGPGLLTSEISDSQAPLDSSSFFGKTGFLQSSFTSCDDVTDEERNRIVENLLSETDEKFLVSDYEMTDGCVSENPDSECNINNESKLDKEEGSSDKNNADSENSAKKNFKCEICGKSFGKQFYLYRHLRKHTGEFRCNICFTVFARKENMMNHRVICSRTEATTQQLVTKIKIVCKFCKMQFYSLSALQDHLVKHYCKGDLWKCSCGKESSDSKLIENHSCQNSKVLVTCVGCSKQFSTAEDFTDHKRRASVGKRRVKKNLSQVCDVCGLSFKTASGVRMHRLTHENRRYECPTCDKKFTRHDTLMDHIQLHNPKKEWTCPVCDKGFSSQKKFKNHHRLMHSEQTGFICPICDKVFRQKGNLKKHERTHEIIRPRLSCIYCDSNFANEETLHLHIISTHTKESAFKCDFCDKPFYAKSQLRRHLRSHRAMYKCAYCGVNTQYKQSLKKHLAAKHNDKIDEWDTPDAIAGMSIRQEKNHSPQTNNEDKKAVEPLAPVKDILQTAAGAVLGDTDNSDIDEPTERQSKSETDVLVTCSVDSLDICENTENDSIQLVALHISHLPQNNNDSQVDSDLMSLNVMDGFPITQPISSTSQPSSEVLPVSLDLETNQDDPSFVTTLENAIVNFPVAIPEGYQLAFDNTVDKRLSDEESTLVNGIQGIGATDDPEYVLTDSPLPQSSLPLEENVLFYIIQAPEENTLNSID